MFSDGAIRNGSGSEVIERSGQPRWRVKAIASKLTRIKNMSEFNLENTLEHGAHVWRRPRLLRYRTTYDLTTLILFTGTSAQRSHDVPFLV